MEKSFGLFFFLKKSSYNGDLKTPDIYVKITVNGKACEVSTKRQCERSKWNVAAGRVVGQTDAAKSINSYLEILQRKIYEHRKQLVDDGKPVSAANIKMLLQGREIDRPKHMLMDIFQSTMIKSGRWCGREYAAGTLERYETSYRHTQNYILWKYKAKDLDIEELDYAFMSEYEFWLKSARKCDHNTTMKYLANFKKIVIRCIKNGWLQRDPFIAFKLTKREVERFALTESEMEKITTEVFEMERTSICA